MGTASDMSATGRSFYSYARQAGALIFTCFIAFLANCEFSVASTLSRVAKCEICSEPEANSRGGQYKSENGNPESEQSGRVITRFSPDLPKGFFRLVFVVGGFIFLLVLSVMMCLLWPLRPGQ